MSYTVEHNGKKIELPDFRELPVGLIRKLRNEPEAEQPWLILETVLDDKGLALVDSMTVSEFAKFMNEWTQGAGLGES